MERAGQPAWMPHACSIHSEHMSESGLEWIGGLEDERVSERAGQEQMRVT